MAQPKKAPPRSAVVASLPKPRRRALPGEAADPEQITRPGGCRAGCGRRGATDHRGLCRKCWADPKVRGRFSWLPVRPGKRWEYDDSPRPLPARPTRAAPGSEEYLMVLAERRRRGERLAHPADRWDPPAELLELVDRSLANHPAAAGLPAEVVRRALLTLIARDKTPGVYAVQKKTIRWRAYPLLPRPEMAAKGKRRRTGRRVHCGYYSTRTRAVMEVLAWRAAGCPATWAPGPE